MTSNVGARELEKGRVGFTGDGAEAYDDDKEFKTTFSPEFRNRLDARVRFGRLTPGVMARIVDKFVAELEGQLAERKVVLKVTPPAQTWLAEKGFDPKMGARPMARLLHDEVRKPLADELLFGRLARGGQVTVDLGEDGKLVFRIEERAVAMKALA